MAYLAARAEGAASSSLIAAMSSAHLAETLHPRALPRRSRLGAHLYILYNMD